MTESTRPQPDGEIHCPFCNSPIASTAGAGDVQCHECGGSFRLAATSSITTVDEGRTLGRFQLLQCVGRGSFGAVWRARDTILGRFVALKIPHRSLLDSTNLRERFRREARAVAQMRHPGIVQVHEVLDIDGQHILVSDFVEGVTLKDLLDTQRLTFREMATLVAEVALALDYAHNQGLVHRDVKPANILIELATADKTAGSVGKALIVDFGLALRDDAEVVLTVDGQLVGTPAYMSPEQAKGGGHRADRRSDVYSLGVVLYQLLCGEPPFRGARNMLVHQVIHETPRAPRRVNDRIPRDLETICLKAMAKEPSWRYPTAGELAADLRRHLRGEPVRARPLGPALRLWLWCRRNPALAGSTGLALTALACLVLLSLAFAFRERHNATELTRALDESNVHLREAQYRLAESHLSRGLALCEQDSIAQGQLWMARALSSAPADAVDLRRYLCLSLAAWQRRQCSLETCLRHPQQIRAVAFSPNGKNCLSLSRDGTCRCWSSASPDAKSPVSSALTPFVAAAVGNSVLVTAETDGTIRRWSIPSFEAVNPPLKLSSRTHAIAVSPDGSLILAAGDDGNASLCKLQGMDFAVTLLSHGGKLRCVALSADDKLAFTGGDDPKAKLWDTASGQVLHDLPHEDVVGCGAFGGGGAILATGCHDGGVRLWDTATGKTLPFHVRHARIADAVAVSADGRFVLSGSTDRSARLWSVATQEPLAAPLLHDGEVTAVAISSDGTHILTAAHQTVRLWSLPRPERIALDAPGQGWIRRITFAPDDKTLITVDGDLNSGGAARLWNALTGESMGPLLVEKEFVVAGGCSPDFRTIAIAGADGTVRLADIRTRSAGLVLHHAGPVYVVAFNPDGTSVLTGGEDRMARVWDARTGQLVEELPRHDGAVMTAGFSPHGDVFFTGDYSGRLCLWRARDLAPVFPCARTDPILAAAFSHDGAWIAIAAGRQVRLMHTSTGDFLDASWNHPDIVRAVAFSPDDQLVLAACDDGTAKCWQTNHPERRAASFSHVQPVSLAIFDPEGRLVLTGSSDGTARLWDVATGKPIGPVLSHQGRVSSAAFSSDGTRFATGSSGRMCWLCRAPVPWDDDDPTVVLRTEVLTGMELDDSEGLRVLDAETWQERASRLRKSSDRHDAPLPR